MSTESDAARVIRNAQPVAEPVPVLYALPRDGDTVRLVLFVPEVAELLRVTPRVVYDLIRSGQLRVRNLHPGSRNSRYLIPVSALIEYLRGGDDPIPPAA